MNIRAREIKYFLALCDTMNFTEAARYCGVSQPALTKAIKTLEDKVGGGPLFHRERGRTHLSELGTALRPYLETIRSELDAAKKTAGRYAVEEGTIVGLAILAELATVVPDVLLQQLLTGLVAENIRIDIALASESDIGCLVRNETVAILLATRESLHSHVHERDYEISDLFNFELGLALPSGHPLAARTEVQWRELPRSDLIDFASYNIAPADASATGEAPQPLPNPVKLAAVAAGAGVALVPTTKSVPAGIVVRPLAGGPSKRTACLAINRSRMAPAIAARIVELAKDALARREDASA